MVVRFPSLVCIGILAGSCSSCDAPKALRSETQAQRLDGTHSVLRVPLELPAFPLEEAVLLVEVEEIQNPARIGFSIHVELEATDEQGLSIQARLGAFSPYPVDRIGTFLLPADAASKELAVRGASRSTALVFELRTADGRRAPEDLGELRVRMGAPRWKTRNQLAEDR
jgi:hypothetical protein